MVRINAEDAGDRLLQLMEEAARNHEPIEIAAGGRAAVLLDREDWESIQETLHLLSVPGMRESIAEGMRTPIEQCDEDPGW